MNEHILKFHDKSRISCDICSKAFGLTELYNKHLKVVHKNGNSLSLTFKCDICNKEFKSKQNLGRHMKSHNKLSCSVCDQLFSGRRELKNHLDTHGYVCVTCLQVFMSEAACDEHMKQEHPNKPLQCHQCSDFFANNISLLRHQKSMHPHDVVETNIENDVKILLVCDKCQKSFSSNSGLAKHKLTCESFVEGFKCGVCSKLFQTKYDLVSSYSLWLRNLLLFTGL